MYMEYVAHHKTSILTVSKFGKKAQFVNFCEARPNPAVVRSVPAHA
jgi:hypothetical protein